MTQRPRSSSRLSPCRLSQGALLPGPGSVGGTAFPCCPPVQALTPSLGSGHRLCASSQIHTLTPTLFLTLTPVRPVADVELRELAFKGQCKCKSGQDTRSTVVFWGSQRRRGGGINRTLFRKPSARTIRPRANGTRNWAVRHRGVCCCVLLRAAAALSHLLSF